MGVDSGSASVVCIGSESASVVVARSGSVSGFVVRVALATCGLGTSGWIFLIGSMRLRLPFETWIPSC